jgi:hypothetical protein
MKIFVRFFDLTFHPLKDRIMKQSQKFDAKDLMLKELEYARKGNARSASIAAGMVRVLFVLDIVSAYEHDKILTECKGLWVDKQPVPA